MSGISSTAEQCKNYDMAGAARDLLGSLRQYLEGFARRGAITKGAKIFHGEYSYDLLPDTAIIDFTNMARVTSVEAGECYVCIFTKPRYQGSYMIIGPGEKITPGACGSIVVGMRKLPVNAIRKNARPPDFFWELSGAKYQWHFATGYKYA